MKQGIKHKVLNAKNHEKEAEIVAQAGKYGAVTIATNMAGRGTDIVLGGNSEYLAKQEMRKQGYDDALIALADSYADTDDEIVLSARKLYRTLVENYSKETKEERGARCGGWRTFHHGARNATNQDGSTTSSAAVPAGREIPECPAFIFPWKTI